MRIAKLLFIVFWLFLIGTYIPSKPVADVFEEPDDARSPLTKVGYPCQKYNADND